MTNSLELDLDHEPLPEQDTPLLPVDQIAPSFECILTSGQKISLAQLLDRSHLLLNFIKGTWCPFCQQHLQNLRAWQKRFDAEKRTMILVLSNESVDVLRQWTQENPLPYLIGSVLSPLTVFRSYGVNTPGESFARPASFLIEKSGKVRMAYDGTRGNPLKKTCEQCGVG